MIPRLGNSIIISFSVTALSAFFGGLGGYYLARNKAPFAKVLFVLVGIALYLPYQAVIIPLVILMAKTKLALTYWGLIISYLILNIPLASVLLGTFFLSVPRELEESAEVDGASRIQTFFNIVVPVSLPAYASVAIIIFTQVWNEFFLALSLSAPEHPDRAGGHGRGQRDDAGPLQPADGCRVDHRSHPADILPVPGQVFYPRHPGRSVERIRRGITHKKGSVLAAASTEPFLKTAPAVE